MSSQKSQVRERAKMWREKSKNHLKIQKLNKSQTSGESRLGDESV